MSEIAPSSATILSSYYHTPGRAVLAAFPVVVRAGHLRAHPDYRVERSRSHGHDLLLCLGGSGWVRVQNRIHSVGRGDLAWIDGYRPHAHWAEPSAPWELLWFRMDGAGLESLGQLLGISEQPVFHDLPIRRLKAEFATILRLMADRAVNMEAATHAVVAQLVATIWQSRRQQSDPTRPAVPAAFAKVINRMTLYPHQAWTAADLARLSGMSVAHFYRRFRQLTGASPIDWLRRERISLAKRRLLETDDSIKAVADQSGYNSPFFFSRDFKNFTGLSPSEFRRHERAAPAPR
jgi:AraC-like DNA-binding protein